MNFKENYKEAKEINFIIKLILIENKIIKISK